MHLTYTGGGKYASAAKSVRIGGKVTKTYTYLGRVVDREKGIYDNKLMGLVKFDLEKGEFMKASPSDVPRPMVPERLILDFGDAYFLDLYIRGKGFMKCIEQIETRNPDTLKALVIYYIVTGEPICNAMSWYEGSYARILYPDANMDGRRISEYFEEIGSEENWMAFFKRYIPLVTNGAETVSVVLDSTGLPNQIRMEITAISNHNGVVSNEVRLILAMSRDDGMPIFMRYVNGNITDQTTLMRTILELKQQGVKCDYVLMDAGYPNRENLRELYSSGIGFISRLQAKGDLYESLLKEALPGIAVKENFTMFGERRLYVRKVDCDLAEGCPGHAYCVLDVDRKNSEDTKLARKAVKEGLTEGEAFDAMEETGFFVLISNMDVPISEIVPDYYVRQVVEQYIDVSKGSADLLPLRTHTKDTFRGHLLVSFIAAAVLQSLQNDLKEKGKVKKHGPEHRIWSRSPNTAVALLSLRNQKCKVYDDVILPSEPQAIANRVYSLYGLTVPYGIPKPPEAAPRADTEGSPRGVVRKTDGKSRLTIGIDMDQPGVSRIPACPVPGDAGSEPSSADAEGHRFRNHAVRF